MSVLRNVNRRQGHARETTMSLCAGPGDRMRSNEGIADHLWLGRALCVLLENSPADGRKVCRRWRGQGKCVCVHASAGKHAYVARSALHSQRVTSDVRAYVSTELVHPACGG